MICRCWQDAVVNWSNGRRHDSRLPGWSLRLRGLPGPVTQILWRWHQGEVHLELLDYVPDFTRLLRMQAQGTRPVSLLISASEILSFEDMGRDFLSFLIHDLLHASHLMAKPEDFSRQVKFARWMESAWARGELNVLFDHPATRGELIYLLSDMNSHLMHLFKTLRWMENRASARLRFVEVLQPEWSVLNSPLEDDQVRWRLLRRWDSAHVNDSGTCLKLRQWRRT
ncbi:MAG: hypothetical protein C5B49_05020 [Bdellovibrio sp.]|nr:MAG: hypothetical protein C5B49_05020 [Bdellovibrio sp.]